MSRIRRAFFALACAAALLSLLPLSGGADAVAGGALKFWVTEYRLSTIEPAEDGSPRLELEIRGRAALYGADKVEFVWTTADGMKWLPLLQACGGSTSRLYGSISAGFEESKNGVEGKGPIEELTCRVILK